jgi:hypothetical protein
MQVYLITNKITGQNYVGQTKWDFNTRYKDGHWHKRTHSRYLKNAVLKYGLENFEVKILCEGEYSEDELTRLEGFYMEQHNALYPNGYNFKEAGKKGRNYYNFKEYELVDADGNIYQISNLRQFCKQQDINYGAMLNMVSGINASSYGYALKGTPIENIINPNQEWELENMLTGELFKVRRKDVPAFAQQHNLNLANLYLLLRERMWVHRGFKLSKTVADGNHIRAETVKYKNIHLIHDDGREATVDNVYQFCLDPKNDIGRSDVYDMISGKSIKRKGWRLASIVDPKQEKLNRLGLKVTLKNIKDGRIIEVKNVSRFARQEGLDKNLLLSMLAGYIKQYMFWTTPDRDLTGYRFPKRTIYVKYIHQDGRTVEGISPGDVARKTRIMSKQSLGDLISGDCSMVKGWSLKQAKFFMDYYPEINR